MAHSSRSNDPSEQDDRGSAQVHSPSVGYGGDKNSGSAAVRRADGTAPHLLVVDDETVLMELLVDSLTFSGYRVDSARTGSQALRATDEHNPDLILLDVNLPDFNGFAVAARLRARGDTTPIMFLTARDAPADLRDGFGAGGDDYLTKPFRLEELRLRVEAILRRTLGVQTSISRPIEVADLVIDVESETVTRANTQLDLNGAEYQLLVHLATNRNKLLSESDLKRQVWGNDTPVASALIESRLASLARKINAIKPPLLHHVNGNGYILRIAKP